MKKNTISVSELSAYAADPKKFCEYKGNPYNAKAAQYGTRAHDNVAKGKNPIFKILIFIVLMTVAIVIFLSQ